MDDGRALSPRETEVIALVAAARTNAEIATALGIARNTVANHLTNAYEALDIIRPQAAARVAAAMWYREQERAQ